MNIIINQEKALVYTPYNYDFVQKIKSIGSSKWNGSAWEVPACTVEQVREIMMDVYGETDIEAAPKMYAKIKVVDTDWAPANRGIYLFGKLIARAYGRDSDAMVGDDVAFTKKAPVSGGSRNRPDVIIEQGAELVIHNIPESKIDPQIPNYGIPEEYIVVEVSKESDVKKSKLLEEKERLLKRIKEIDDILEN